MIGAVLRLVAQSCPTLCDPMDCSQPGSSVPGILQARILEWVAMLSSRGSSQHRDRTQVSQLQADSLLSEPSAYSGGRLLPGCILSASHCLLRWERAEIGSKLSQDGYTGISPTPENSTLMPASD